MHTATSWPERTAHTAKASVKALLTVCLLPCHPMAWACPHPCPAMLFKASLAHVPGGIFFNGERYDRVQELSPRPVAPPPPPAPALGAGSSTHLRVDS
jgi:hypothetical protein